MSAFDDGIEETEDLIPDERESAPGENEFYVDSPNEEAQDAERKVALSHDDVASADDSEDPEEDPEPEPEPYTDSYGDDFSMDGAQYDGDEEGGDDDDYDMEHPGEAQDRDILNADEHTLGDPLKNDAFILDRNKIILVITAVVFVLLILFLIMPNKRQQKKNEELEKAGMVYIPSEIDRWTMENENASSAGKAEPDSNSAQDKPRDFSIPGINDAPSSQEAGRAPVEVPKNLSGKNGNGNFPVTNRNEQQKAFFSVPLDRTGTGGLLGNLGNGASGGYSRQTFPGSFQSGASTYTPASLQNNMAAYLAQQNASSYDRQNNQDGKQGFMDKERGKAGTYQWNSDFSLWKGTVIPAVLDTGINTDLPGQVIATVTENVYSSNNGNYILIPQGSRLFAEYNSSISYAQNRVQVIWNTLIRPDGLEINLGSANGVDAYGFSGYKGSVTNHPFQYVKALGLIAMFSILDTKMNNVINTQGNQYAQNAMSDAYSTTKRISEKIIDRALDIQPTLKIPSGTKIDLITNITMELPPIDPYPVEEKYRRER